MPFQREIPAEFRREIERQESGEAALIFLRITHPGSIGGANVVSDPEEFILDGITYQGFEFRFTMLTDNEQAPKATLTIQNVDRIIGEAVRNSVDPIHIEAHFIALSQFDLSVFPRVALSDPVERITSIYHAILTDVEGDSMFLTGTVRTYDYTQELFPGMRATQARCPGLYW
jgi:hypothetical protein